MDKPSGFVKSKTDSREYRYTELSNGVRCLLVSDTKVEQSAASLDVKVGSLSNPPEYPGLAHFCEHMLFLGTEKYPAENEYSMFIVNHGGQNNAYTGYMDTNYHFSVSNSSFPEALEMFSEFFKEPLFNADSIEREIQSVDSEYKKGLHNDYNKLHQVIVSLANPASVVNRFTTGSAETLDKPEIREKLLDFYTRHYSANLMTLVLLGNHPLDTLENWAKEYFEGIVNKHAKVLDPAQIVAFGKPQLGKLLKVVPDATKHLLSIMWLFPDTWSLYRSKPEEYVGHLLGQQGPSSLLSYLIDEGLALELEATFDSKEANAVFITADIELTDKGLSQYERVIEIVCAYAKMLRDKCPQKYIADELIQTSKLKFDYLNQLAPYEAVCELSKNLHSYPKEIVHDLLAGPHIVSEYNAEAIKRLLDRMTPENMLVVLSSETCRAHANLEEKWYNTIYSVTDFSSALLARLKNMKVGPSVHRKVLDLPPPNILIPKSIELLPLSPGLINKVPRLVKETAGSSVWYKRDDKFGVPQAYGYCRIWTNDNGFPVLDEAHIFMRLYLQVFFEEIREFTYMVETAGMKFGFDFCYNRLSLDFSGFSTSLPVLVQAFLNTMKEFPPEKRRERFEIKRLQEISNEESILRDTPSIQCMDDYQVGLCSLGQSHYRKLELLREFTFAKFVHYSKHWLRTTRLEWFISGNITEEAAIKIALDAEPVLSRTPLPRELVARERTTQIPLHTEYAIIKWLPNEEELNSCLVSYFQYGSYLNSELHAWAMNEVAFEFISQASYDYLRTKEQLGYVVDSHADNINRVLGGLFLIQSSKMAPERLYQKVDEFLEAIWETIEELSDDEFKMHVEAVCAPLRQKPTNLNEEHGENWSEIVTHDYMFDKNERLIKELEGLKKADVINYFRDLFFDSVRRYDYELVCNRHEEENEAAREENREAAINKGNRRIYVDSEEEVRAANFMYPDIYMVNLLSKAE